MPYVACPCCAARSYLAPAAGPEPCPVCRTALHPPRRPPLPAWPAPQRPRPGV